MTTISKSTRNGAQYGMATVTIPLSTALLARQALERVARREALSRSLLGVVGCSECRFANAAFDIAGVTGGDRHTIGLGSWSKPTQGDVYMATELARDLLGYIATENTTAAGGTAISISDFGRWVHALQAMTEMAPKKCREIALTVLEQQQIPLLKADGNPWRASSDTSGAAA